jgi:hypothetical protein
MASAHAIPDIPTPDAYWETLRPHLPLFSPDEQRVAIALYRELAKGRAVDVVQLGRALGVSLAETRALLQQDSIKCLTYADGEGRILGFGGLAAVRCTIVSRWTVVSFRRGARGIACSSQKSWDDERT